MITKTHKFGGVGASTGLRQSIKGLLVCDVGTTITAANALILGATDAAGWMAILAPKIATSAYEKGVFIDLSRGVEIKTAEMPMTESNMGLDEQTGDIYEKMTGYGFMSHSEYLGFAAMSGLEKEIFGVMKNGDIIGTKSGADYKGFLGRIFTKQGSLSKVGADLQKENAFEIRFDEPEEWEADNFVNVATNFSFRALKALCPVGLDAVVTTAYSTPNVTIKVNLRDSLEPYAGVAAAANIQIVQAYNDAVCAVATVTQTSAAIGSYPVALTASLNGPCYARIKVDGANGAGYVSNVFRIV